MIPAAAKNKGKNTSSTDPAAAANTIAPIIDPT